MWFSGMKNSLMLFAVAAAIPAVVFAPRGAQAQQAAAYSEIPPKWDETSKDLALVQDLRRRETLVHEILTGRTPFNAQTQAEFDEYFRRHFFPKMTQVSNLGNLDDDRQAFFKTRFYQVANAPPAARDYLLKLTFQMMQTIATNYGGRLNFHPYVRYNAMLIIGELNEQETSGSFSARRPAVPYGPALDFLLNQLKDPNQIDLLRVAALDGVLRHAQITRIQHQLPGTGVSADSPQEKTKVQRILSVVQPIAEEKDPPEGRSVAGHTWMRRRAIEVLMALRSGSEFLTLFDEIIADQDAPLSLRCTAAEAIGKMPAGGAGQQNFDPLKTSMNVAAIAVEACQAELAWWDAEKKREEEKKRMQQGSGGYPSGYSGMGYPGGEGGYPGYEGSSIDAAMSAASESGAYPSSYPGYGMSGPMGKPPEKKKKVEPRLEKTQRRIKDCLYYVKLALDGNTTFSNKEAKTPPGAAQNQPAAPPEGGIMARANAQQKTKVKELSMAIVDVFQAVDKVDVTREAMLTDLRAQLDRLQALTGISSPPAGPPPTSGPPPAGGLPTAGVPAGPSSPASAPPPEPAANPPAGSAPPANGAGAPPANGPNAAPPAGNAPAPNAPPANVPPGGAPPANVPPAGT
jgi:hypothetical protein